MLNTKDLKEGDFIYYCNLKRKTVKRVSFSKISNTGGLAYFTTYDQKSYIYGRMKITYNRKGFFNTENEAYENLITYVDTKLNNLEAEVKKEQANLQNIYKQWNLAKRSNSGS